MPNSSLPKPQKPAQNQSASNSKPQPLKPGQQVKAQPVQQAQSQPNSAQSTKVPAGLSQQAPGGSAPNTGGGPAARPLTPPTGSGNLPKPGAVPGRITAPIPQQSPSKTTLPSIPGARPLGASPGQPGSVAGQQPKVPIAQSGGVASQPPMRSAGQTGAQASGAGGNNAPPTNSGGRANQVAGRQPPQSPQLTSPKKSGMSAKFAQVKKSPLRFLPLVLGAVVLIGVLVFAGWKILGNKDTQSVGSSKSSKSGVESAGGQTGKQITLTYWGLWEPSEVLAEVFQEFEQENPGVKVDYRKQSHRDYRERLQTAIASGNGPDLFRYHATWVPMLTNELEPMPTSVMTVADYKKIFYPVAAEQLQAGGQIVGIPLMYDGLALYYNKEILKTANKQYPKTWTELRQLAADLTVPAKRNSTNDIQRAGLAIGNASNVEHFADILALLILQNGGNPAKPTSKEVQDALTFYVNFVLTDQVWSETLPNSTVAFARGEVAMMFAPSWRAHEVKAMNPDLDFGIAPVPKLSGSEVAWASYWAEGVSNKSENKAMAWRLLQFLSSKETMQKLYSNQKKVRSFGEIYSRQDLASELQNDALVAAFLTDAPQAQSWHMCSYTHDKGINDNTIKYYEDAVNAMLQGKRASDVVVTLDQGVRQVSRQYQ
ncbi:MAG: extracellular solute-binding protein [Candidatus Pacebacteria bacterium]|nr:extracellular solute-binding protein [Candidatus Paceibacterota bacterium]